jgi:nicotinamidase-related amidase
LKQALLIIDVQNDYFDGGKMPLHNPTKALEHVERILLKFRERGLPVIHIQHINEPDDTFFQPDTDGAEIHSRLMPLSNEYHLIKHMPSSFLGTNLEKL